MGGMCIYICFTKLTGPLISLLTRGVQRPSNEWRSLFLGCDVIQTKTRSSRIVDLWLVRYIPATHWIMPETLDVNRFNLLGQVAVTTGIRSACKLSLRKKAFVFLLIRTSASHAPIFCPQFAPSELISCLHREPL